MIIDDTLLQTTERMALQLRQLYYRHGYLPYRMSKFEEYDFYAGNKEFLVSDNVITFTDTNGRLMAMKPDVTLSIIKNSEDRPDRLRKLSYLENVYRVGGGDNSFREITQTGVECFGCVGSAAVREVVALALESLKLLNPHSLLELSDLRITEHVIAGLGLPQSQEKALYTAIGQKNFHAIDALCGPRADRLKALLEIHGTPEAALPRLKALVGEELVRGLEALASLPEAAMLRLDFSLTGDTHYYNGIIFKGFLPGIPTAVLSGGQYDRLMEKLHRRSRAIGFAVYTDFLDRVEQEQPGDDGWLNIALPKGRLGEKVYAMFARAGFECPAILEQNRKLVFENPEKKVRYFWVKPSDVAIYVERGAADLGVAGKDILLEYEPDIYELLDLNTGKCRMTVAGPGDFTDDPSRKLRVATKFSRIARNYYQALGRDVDLIHLNGSIELAPILGLSDVIVDIVETGSTLRENNLAVLETICPISARLIASKASYKFKQARIQALRQAMAGVVEEAT